MDQPDFWIERQLSQSLPEEIARFDRKGFYYKGEFIDDAGEVHRLLKQVLESKLNIATPPPEPQEPVIPDQYKGHQLHVYRAGFHAGYKHGLTRAPAALATAPPEPPTDMALEPSFSQRQQLLQGLSHYLRGGGDE